MNNLEAGSARRSAAAVAVVALSVLMPAFAVGQPASQPASSYDRPMRPRAESLRDRAAEAIRPGTDAMRQDLPYFRPLNDAEHEEAIEFAREKMPNFYEIWQELPPERRRRMPPRVQLGFRLLLDAARSEDKRLYDSLSKQMELKDELIGIMRDSPRGFQSREAFREKTREVVQSWLEQREARLEQMQRMLEQEHRRLEEDKKNPEALVDNHFQRLRNEVRGFLFLADRIKEGTSGEPTSPQSPVRPDGRAPGTQPSGDAGGQTADPLDSTLVGANQHGD